MYRLLCFCAFAIQRLTLPLQAVHVRTTQNNVAIELLHGLQFIKTTQTQLVGAHCLSGPPRLEISLFELLDLSLCRSKVDQPIDLRLYHLLLTAQLFFRQDKAVHVGLQIFQLFRREPIMQNAFNVAFFCFDAGGSCGCFLVNAHRDTAVDFRARQLLKQGRLFFFARFEEGGETILSQHNGA